MLMFCLFKNVSGGLCNVCSMRKGLLASDAAVVKKVDSSVTRLLRCSQVTSTFRALTL